MHYGKLLTAFAAAAAILTTACGANRSAARNDGRFFLVDQRTQIPVMCCSVPPSWLAGGKTTWTAEPAQPVHWYVWFMPPDQQCKIFISSLTVLASSGRIDQVPFLRDPNVLAKALLPGARRDHNLPDARIVEARFIAHQPDRNLIQSRIQQAQQHGIRPTGFHFTELFIRLEGSRGGTRISVIFSLPMLATENRPTARSFTTVTELLCPMSYSCPAGTETATKQTLEKIVGTMQLNPDFTAVVNRIAQQRTANWIRVQNQIRDQQMEVARTTSATQDRVRNMWSEYIRDVDTVSNPATGEKMFVDNRYDHAWINNNGEVIYHNSGFNTPNASTASFDPNSNSLFNRDRWQKLR